MTQGAIDLDLLRRHEAAAVAAFEAGTGSTSLCTLSRSGRSHPAAKYHEGAVAALGDVRRALTTSAPGTLATDVAAYISAGWTARFERMTRPGRDWQAYYTGGIEALDRLIDMPGTD
jgi:hypothetical protein